MLEARDAYFPHFARPDERLNFLRRMLIVDTAPLQELFAAAQGPSSVWSGYGIRYDLTVQRLHHCQLSALHDLPVPTPASMAQWIHFVLSHLDTWKSIVGAPAQGRLSQPQAGVDAAEPPIVQPDIAFAVSVVHQSGALPGQNLDGSRNGAAANDFRCSECSSVGKSRAGLRMHERRVHGIQSDLASRIASTTCPAGSLVFASRHWATDHLRDSLRCRH
eukprot:18410-Amphidinium_carterae.1